MFGLVKKNNSNTEQEYYEYNTNFYKIKSGIFKDTYMYIDDDNLNIDEVLIKYCLPVKFKGTFSNSEYNFNIGILSCSKKLTTILEEKVFTELDYIMLNKYGKKYDEFIEEVIKLLHRFLTEGDVLLDIQQIKGEN